MRSAHAWLVLLCGSAIGSVLGWPTDTLARKPGTNQLICDEIHNRYRVAQRQLNARTLNFLLFDASERGCVELMEQFLAKGASVRARDRGGNTALSIAARMGENQAVELLLEHDSDIGYQNLAGSTALLRAAQMNRRRTVKLLLRAGADPNVANRQGLTPLIVATYNGNNRLVDTLLDAGAKPTAVDRSGKSALVYAAGKGYAKIVDKLLATGIDVDTRYHHDLTALMWAAGHSADVPVGEGLDTVALLLLRGAEVDLVDNRGRSALMVAVERGHVEIVA